MIGIEPIAFGSVEEFYGNQPAVDGGKLNVSNRDSREALAFLDGDEVFDPDAVLALEVISRLVGDHHARFERHGILGAMPAGPSWTDRNAPTPWPVP